jgi:glycosyltransferase involved in cell wall biosynthesis
LNNYNLSLFFTRGVSLKTWVDTGLFEREKKIYEAHLEAGNFKTIYWLTYGSDDYLLANDLKKQGRLHTSIFICQMPGIFNIPKLGSWLYSLFLPVIHYKLLLKSQFFKTNQIDGSWSAVISKLILKKPLIVRCGYEHYRFSILNNSNKWKQALLKICSKIAYNNADIIHVSSLSDKDFVIREFNIRHSKIMHHSNWIDINLFSEKDNIEKYTDRIIVVGRLEKQKNLKMLLAALVGSKYSVDIVGEGSERPYLEYFATDNNVHVRFLGKIDNNRLPEVLSRYLVYVLASEYEGNPKTMLEAMSCGCAVVGTNVPGINTVIEHNENGILCENDKYSLMNAINILFEDNSLRQKLSKNARIYVINNCSLDSYIKKELTMYASISNKK